MSSSAPLNPSRTVEQASRLIVWVTAGIWALTIHWPILLGRVPIPAELLLSSPAWREQTIRTRTEARHAEMGDALTQGFPWYVQRRERLLSGDLPLWNERALLGTPFLAENQPGVLNPVAWLLLPLPPTTGWSLSIALKTMLSFAFTAFAARRLGATLLGALVGGAIFSGSGFMTAWSLWPITDSALWLPAVVWATIVLHQRGNRRSCVVTAALLAMPLLAGHAEIAAFVAMTGGLLALFLTFFGAEPRGQSRSRFLARFALSAVISLGLAAAQILPTLDWIGSLSRPSHKALGLALPANDVLGFLSRDTLANPNSLGVAIPEGASYVGMAALLLAPLALLAQPRIAGFFAALGATSAAIAFSVPPFFDLFHQLPLLRAAPANRLLLLTEFSLALLAALAFSKLEHRGFEAAGRRRARRIVGLVTASITALVVATLVLADSARGALFSLPGGLFSTLAILAGSVALLLRVLTEQDSRIRRRLLLALALLTACDLGTVAASHHPYFPSPDVYPQPKVLSRLESGRGAPYRVGSVNSVVPVNALQFFGLRDPVGYEYPLRTTERFLRPLTEQRFAPSLVDDLDSARLAAGGGARFRLTNTKYIVASRLNGSSQNLEREPTQFRLVEDLGAVQLFEFRRALPRAWFVPTAGRRPAPTPRAALDLVDAPDFDPESQVVLFGPADPESASAPAAGPARARSPVVVEVHSNGDSRSAALQIEEAGYVVVSEAFDRGWTATIDDRPVRVLRANFALLAVDVAPGARHLRLDYRPRSFLLGRIISLATLLALLIAMAVRWGREVQDPDRTGAGCNG